MCIRAGLRHERLSATLLVLGAALAAWGLGDVVLTIETLGGATAPAPSPADLLYLSFFPLSYVAVVLFIRGEQRRLSSPSWLDGAVAGMGAAAVLAAFAFQTIEHTAHKSGLATAVNLAYPLGDVLLLLLGWPNVGAPGARRRAPVEFALGFDRALVADVAAALISRLRDPGATSPTSRPAP